jgi:hypothetical protein
MFDGRGDIKLPPAFSGPGQLLLFTRYGDPRQPGWESKWLTRWCVQQLHPWFPLSELRIHKHFWPLRQSAFLELEKLGLHKEINTCDCCVDVGHLHKSPVLSVHSWGAAIDLNARDNPGGTTGTWSNEFIAVMHRHGIYCGQCWNGYGQPTHFSMVNG